ncbi:MAG: riboflavin biosynthesis protein RibF [Gemmatimonadetes bacterium]|nr:riboflavin biosynthesis protein RibF [Gemmatimonadota bacterium]
MPERMDWHVESGLPPNVQGTVLTVGTFDGVHAGHRLVLERLAARAEATGLRSVLVTFEPHPLEIVNPANAPHLLTVGDEKIEVLAESRLDYLAVLPFTPTLAQYDAPTFVDAVLRERFGMRELLIGYDHGFGRGRSGDAHVLRELGAREGFGVEVVPPVIGPDGRPVSSTSIRRAIAGGDLERAEGGLGRHYGVSGVVIEGLGRGRTLGFRTINLSFPPPRKLLPPDGVYAVRVCTPLGSFGGMMNLGGRPTFDDPARSLEAHLFDTTPDLYGRRVRVDLVRRLREVRKFADAGALMEQLARDEDAARAALAEA